MSLLNEFEDLPAAVTRIDQLVEAAQKAKSKSERRANLKEAQRIANEYERHCMSNGNFTKQFKTLYES